MLIQCQYCGNCWEHKPYLTPRCASCKEGKLLRKIEVAPGKEDVFGYRYTKAKEKSAAEAPPPPVEEKADVKTVEEIDYAGIYDYHNYGD